MVGIGGKWLGGLKAAAPVALSFLMAAVMVSADRSLKRRGFGAEDVPEPEPDHLLLKVVHFLWQPDDSSYRHVWPDMALGWQIVLGSIIGFFGAAFGSVGGVGGGGIYVPMLTLIIGFDAKSSTAISKCMIMGAAGSTVYYNLKLRHPTLDMPIIDYDLALLFQPMLMLGISIGVAFNVIFADWMVTVLLIVLFIGTSSKAFLKGVETWKKETLAKKEAAKRAELNGRDEVEYKPIPSGPANGTQEIKAVGEPEVNKSPTPLGSGLHFHLSNLPFELNPPSISSQISIIENVCWKELGLLVFVWFSFLGLQVAKNYTTTCSTWYWILNLLQLPVSLGVTLHQAFSLYTGKRVIASKGDEGATWKIRQLAFYCFCGVLAGVVGGLLGLGGGFILGPLFLELGIPPQVSSATATFAMTFSSSMSVVEYYLLRRFPIPYALYFTAVATVAAFIGQHVVRKLIIILGRASLIIFILAFTIFVSAISLEAEEDDVAVDPISKDMEGDVGVDVVTHRLRRLES
ncbi:hypothetical protein Taro_024345 [Colocasia esculenta]|uniref:Sulfite exporter TauE/SafE family protein n=1 Tax=Colocasia esculenta TaxID=4460 RepID=A0A843V031_COLES|nr:hypothetical protein [Colocasia esculenta]